MLNNLYNLIDNKNSLYFCYTYNRQFFLDFKRISLINNIKLLLILYVAYSENYAFNFTNLVRTDVNFISFFFFNAYGLNFINYYNIYFKFYMNLFIELNKRFLY